MLKWEKKINKYKSYRLETVENMYQSLIDVFLREGHK